MTKQDKEFVQYSKRVCKWSLLGVFALVIIAMALCVFVCTDVTQIDAVVRLIQYFSTLAGVVVTGYFGRDTLEDFATNRKSIQKALDNQQDDEEEESVG